MLNKHGRTKVKVVQKYIYIISFVLTCSLLTACESGTDNVPESTADNVPESVAVDDVEILSTYQGSVGDGPIVGATVTIKDKNGVVLGSQTADAFANYKISIKAKGKSYPLTIEATGGVDLVTNAAPTFMLVSTVLHPSAKIANINPFSTFIVETAEAMGGLTNDNVNQASRTVLKELNFGFDDAVMSDPIGDRVTESKVALIVKTSESLGELVRRTQAAAFANGLDLSEAEVISALSADLSDGALDGQGVGGVSGEVSLLAKMISGKVILEALPNKLQVNDVEATIAMDASIQTVMPDASPMPHTGQVPSTAEMISQLETAIKIGQRIAPSLELSELMASTSSLVGVMPATAASILPDDAHLSLDDGLNMVATLSADDVSELNFSIAGEINHPPVITGIAPGFIAEGMTYLFEPEASDIDSEQLNYEITNKPVWAEFDVDTGVLSGTPGFDDAGEFNEITISVSDGKDSAALTPFSIVVEDVNRSPSISGVPLTGLIAGAVYDFSPVAVDLDGDALTFSITNKPSWSEFNVMTGRLSGLSDNSHVGTYQGIMIRVSDGSETVSLPAFSITVGLNNSAPTINGVPGRVVSEASTYSFTPAASDVDGNALAFSIINRPSWADFNANTGQLSGVPSYSDSGVYNNIRIGVSDGYVVTSLAPFDITVTNVNRAPTISGIPATTIDEGALYRFTPVAEDLDGDTISFDVLNKPAWARLNPFTGELSGIPDFTSSQVYRYIVLQVSDGHSTASLPLFDIAVVNVNRAPTISGTPITMVGEGEAYSFTPAANDLDNDALTFSILNRPAWASFNVETGELSGVPDSASSQVYGNIVLQVSDGHSSASLAPFDITVANVNRAPTISGTPSVSVDEGASYSFTPVANDLDNDALTFSILNQPAWASFNVETGELSGVPDFTSSQLYGNIVLQVSDGHSSASLAPFNITVVNVNRVPTIGGTPPVSVEEGVSYRFIPNVNDVDNDALTFSVLNRPIWAVLNPLTGELSGTPDFTSSQVYGNIVIQVSDGDSNASLAPFDITVVNVNRAPTISGTPITMVSEGGTYNFTPIANDLDNDALTFSILNRPAWAVLNPLTGELSGSPDSASSQVYSNIVLQVSDGHSSASLAPFDITVTNVNQAPTISGTPSVSVDEGASYSFTPVANDLDNDALTFSILNRPAWASFNAETGELSGVPDFASSLLYENVILRVSDGMDTVSLAPFNIMVTNVNRAPTISGIPPVSVDEGAAYRFAPTVNDLDNDALTFSVLNRPAWAVLNPLTGELSGTPDFTSSQVYGNIILQVSDGDSNASLAPFDITVVNVNRAPTISGTPITMVSEGGTYNFTPASNDLDNDALTFSILNQPAWASFNVETGELSGVPDSASSQVYSNIVLQVSDGHSSASLAPFDITVTNVNQAPTISGTPPVSVDEGASYSFTPVANDLDNDALTFSILNQPAWASFNVETGELSGVPDSASSQVYSNIVLQVSDGHSSASLAPFDITVTNVNQAPTISGTPPVSVDEGASYSFTPVANDLDNDALTFSILNRPAWASFNVETGELSGVPDYASSLLYENVTLRVSDGMDTVSLAPFNVTVVNVNQAPTISGTPPVSVDEGASYSFTPVANDLDNDALTFSILNQPAWASFSAETGELSGVPDSASSQVYSNIVLQVSDGHSSASLAPFDITVTNVNQAPTISGTPPVSVDEGASYSFTPTASDLDNDALTFSILNQPAWASFNAETGELSGVPDYASSLLYENVTLRVSDGTDTVSLAPFNITVTNVNRAPTISGSPATIIEEGMVYRFVPEASDADDDILVFSIVNKPVWASFNSVTGELSGVPAGIDVGSYVDISISVSDAEQEVSLVSFSIDVNAVQVPVLGNATLSWGAPVTRVDGSPLSLSELQGYRIYYGTDPDSLELLIDLSDPTVVEYLVEDLAEGTHYFAVSVYDVAGNESERSAVRSKTIQVGSI